jgi:hypothetical protein
MIFILILPSSAMAKKTIYIHIGTPKTGTTSIQTFLTKNTNILLKKGIFYPATGRCYPETSVCMNGGVVNDINALKEVLENFTKSKKSKMLLSEECLFLQNPKDNWVNKEGIWDIFSNYEVKIIVYFRRSVDYLCSFWQEKIKYRGQDDLLYFLENDEEYLNNIKNFHYLATKVGKENVIVRTFEKETWLNSSLIEDFLSIFNIKMSEEFQVSEIVNPSLSRDMCDKLLYVNKHLGMTLSDIDHYGINKRIPASINNQKVIDSLPDEVIKNISDRYYRYECEIAKNFLNRKELFQSKYPEIYQKSRLKYKECISKKDRRELRLIINSTLQRRIIEALSGFKES